MQRGLDIKAPASLVAYKIDLQLPPYIFTVLGQIQRNNTEKPLQRYKKTRNFTFLRDSAFL